LAPIDAGRLPDVVAARMTAESLELVLTSSQPDAPAPWTVDETGTRWSISRTDDLRYDPAERAYHFAPFPTLPSVGYTSAGEHWLLYPVLGQTTRRRRGRRAHRRTDLPARLTFDDEGKASHIGYLK